MRLKKCKRLLSSAFSFCHQYHLVRADVWVGAGCGFNRQSDCNLKSSYGASKDERVWKEGTILWKYWEVYGMLPQESEICGIFCKVDNIHERKTSKNVTTHNVQPDFYFVWQLLWTENSILKLFPFPILISKEFWGAKVTHFSKGCGDVDQKVVSQH